MVGRGRLGLCDAGGGRDAISPHHRAGLDVLNHLGHLGRLGVGVGEQRPEAGPVFGGQFGEASSEEGKNGGRGVFRVLCTGKCSAFVDWFL